MSLLEIYSKNNVPITGYPEISLFDDKFATHDQICNPHKNLNMDVAERNNKILRHAHFTKSIVTIELDEYNNACQLNEHQSLKQYNLLAGIILHTENCYNITFSVDGVTFDFTPEQLEIYNSTYEKIIFDTCDRKKFQLCVQ